MQDRPLERPRPSPRAARDALDARAAELLEGLEEETRADAETGPGTDESAPLAHSLHSAGATRAEASPDARFAIERSLGEGGMGRVYAAHDSLRDRRVALKRVVAGPDTAGLEQRLLEEARALSSLRHEAIVECYDIGRDADGLFLTMELLEGGTLADRLREGPLPPDETRALGLRLLHGLEAAHEAGVIHRDVKPGNILFDAEGRAKLGDFGLARRADRLQLTLTQAALGTMAYMAPEQAQGASEVDARADLYGLAATLYHCLTGESPRVVREKRIPEELREVLSRALEEDPDARFPDAASFRAALGGQEAPAEVPTRAADSRALVEADRKGELSWLLAELETLDKPGREAELLWSATVYGHAYPELRPALQAYEQRARERASGPQRPCERCGVPEAADLMLRFDGTKHCGGCMHVRAARVKRAYRAPPAERRPTKALPLGVFLAGLVCLPLLALNLPVGLVMLACVAAVGAAKMRRRG